MRKLPLEVIIFSIDYRDHYRDERIYGLLNRTLLFFAIYEVGVISEFYFATGESMENIHEPNRTLVLTLIPLSFNSNFAGSTGYEALLEALPTLRILRTCELYEQSLLGAKTN